MTRRHCWHDSLPIAGDPLGGEEWKDGRKLCAVFRGDYRVRQDEDGLKILRGGSAAGGEPTLVCVFPGDCYEGAQDERGDLGVYQVDPGHTPKVATHDASRATNYHRVRALSERHDEFWRTHRWQP